MCPHCKHTLGVADLVPVLSWAALRGKCRYCGAPVSVQYPLIELLTAAAFVASYFWWPRPLQGAEIAIFALWLVLLIGFMALLVYDIRWYLLPDRIVFPLLGVAALQEVIRIAAAPRPWHALLLGVGAVLVGGGIFYAIFLLSGGKWMGGGDVKLGWVLGLTLGTPALAFLMIFLASILGSVVALPLLAVKKLGTKSMLPFGPFLIVAAIICQLAGPSLLDWYQRTFLVL